MNAFQLQEIMPGSFLAQCLAGAALGVLFYVLLITLWDGNFNLRTLLSFTRRFMSPGDWPTTATWPLRFMCLSVTVLWLFILARDTKGSDIDFGFILFAGLPLLYMGISAFLTFNQPGKTLLLVLAILGNLPVVLGSLVSLAAYGTFPKAKELLILFIICWAFIISWAIFVAARINGDNSDAEPLTILPDRTGIRTEGFTQRRKEGSEVAKII